MQTEWEQDENKMKTMKIKCFYNDWIEVNNSDPFFQWNKIGER